MSAAADAIPVAAESIAEAKVHLRLDGSDDDALIGRLVGAATVLCESFTGTMLITRAVRETIPVGAEWRRLSVTPVRAILAVEGLVADGTSFALPTDSYAIDIDANGDGWVRLTQPGSARRATMRYQAAERTTGPNSPRRCARASRGWRHTSTAIATRPTMPGRQRRSQPCGGRGAGCACDERRTGGTAAQSRGHRAARAGSRRAWWGEWGLGWSSVMPGRTSCRQGPARQWLVRRGTWRRGGG